MKHRNTLGLRINTGTPPVSATDCTDNALLDNFYKDGPVRILPFLYIGDERNASDANVLEKYKFKYVVNATAEVVRKEKSNEITYLKLNWTHQQPNIIEDFSNAFDIIDQARQRKETVLVHCQCGISRSASLIIAYVMYRFFLSSHDAYKFVQTKSAKVSPSLTFMYQLLEFDRHVQHVHKPALLPSRLCHSSII